uniref:Uncharacterized protein n=1 Tax=Strongyloides venezuelensis TaxID=75913 RepID=A0A0K0FLH4_STRVS
MNSFFFTTNQLECFIGVALGSHAQDITGSVMPCTGMCSNVTLAIHDTVATIFTCDPFDVCATIEIDNECTFQWLDISMCCCSNENYCNVKNWIMAKAVSQSPDSFTESPLPSDIPPQETIECYVGIDFYERMRIENYLHSNNFSIVLKKYIFMLLTNFNIHKNSENLNIFLQQHILSIMLTVTNKNNNSNIISLNDYNENLGNNYNELIKPLQYLYNGQGLVIKMNCTGNCANTTLGDAGMVYFCDPEYFCMTHNLEDKCNDMDYLLISCCCSSPYCNMNHDNCDGDKSTSATFFPIETTTSFSNLKNNSKINSFIIVLFYIALIFLK